MGLVGGLGELGVFGGGVGQLPIAGQPRCLGEAVLQHHVLVEIAADPLAYRIRCVLGTPVLRWARSSVSSVARHARRPS